MFSARLPWHVPENALTAHVPLVAPGGAADRGEAPADHAGFRRGINQIKKPRRARIERMEAMTIARHVADALPFQRIHFGCHRVGQAFSVGQNAAKPRVDRVVKRDRLLTGAAVHIAQHVDGRGHGVVDVDAAGHCHAGGGDRRRLGPMIHRGDQCRL